MQSYSWIELLVGGGGALGVMKFFAMLRNDVLGRVDAAIASVDGIRNEFEGARKEMQYHNEKMQHLLDTMSRRVDRIEDRILNGKGAE